MEYRQLGRSGMKVPAFSFGTATFGGTGAFFERWGTSQDDEAQRIVDLCLDHGISLFDTADIYSRGLSEEILGKALKGKRDRTLIASKSTFSMGTNPNEKGSSRHHLIRAFEASLKRL
jgi:aryl-alcohol dehydrogenase-like predicted oxidoreductase